MKLSRKDLAFGVGAVAILLIVLLGTGKKLTSLLSYASVKSLCSN
jgi:hypothetical protein